MSLTVNPQYNGRAPYKGTNQEVQTVPSVEHAQNTPPQEKPQGKWLKPIVVLSAATSVGLALAHISRQQKVKLIDAKGFSEKFKPKNWNFNKIKYETKEVFQIATASTVGGLLAGIAIDKENTKYKVKEGIQQLVGNIIMPIGSAALMGMLFEKGKHKINFKSQKVENAVKMVTSLAALGVGMVVGNHTARKINSAIYGEKHERKIQADDLASQLDDICISTMLIAPDNKFLKKIGQFIPLALIVPGYETGIRHSNSK